MPEAIPNEFGVSQDDDWLTEDAAAAESDEDALKSVVTQEKYSLDLSDLDIPIYGEASAEKTASEELSSVDTDDESPKVSELDDSEEDFKLDKLKLTSLSEIASEAAF